MDNTTDAVFLTGATGFVGMELLARYLERSERRVYALVRGRDEADVQARMRRTLLDLFGAGHDYTERVVAVRGDLTRPAMGVAGGVDRLVGRVNEIVHSAASVSFELEAQATRAINVDGTRRVLEFAERCHAHGALRRMSYISTAYVAGEHVGCFSEDDLDVGQRFRNVYEQSKFEAECLIKRSHAQLPITIFRPSIIVGERDSGWTTSFNVLYWPLRAFSRGAYAALPARRDAPVDVVPVDYVADAMFALSQSRGADRATFHLTAGTHASSVGEVVELATAFFKRPLPRLIEPALYRRVVHPLLLRSAPDERTRRALARSEVFFPYFAMRVGFDERRARVALRGAAIRPAPLNGYFERLIKFALAAEWGRRRISRATANGRRTAPGRAAVTHDARARLVLAE
ncbi:MAG TPA: SDR family oxidoreductase [Solirubrobacteraceae bacterium]|nr:SDR family oxidoreductase [Solirubrobacteraceae bacterium]